MALPPNTQRFGNVMDPQEVLDYTLPCAPLLEIGESIDDFDITPFAESIALGLVILGDADGYEDPSIVETGQSIKIWFTIDGAHENNVAFDDGGTDLPLQLHFSTDSDPVRERDRAFILPVAQRGD